MDLCLEIHQDMWAQHPDSTEVGEQVFLCAAAVWDTKVMAESSRKMFNGVKDEIWARAAAWAEWANVRQGFPPSFAIPPLSLLYKNYILAKGERRMGEKLADRSESTSTNSFTTLPASCPSQHT